MKALLYKLRKRPVWGIGVFVLCTLLFMSFFAWKDHNKIEAALGDAGEYALQDEEGNMVGRGGTLVMRRASEIYKLLGVPGNISASNITWSSQSPGIISIVDGTGTEVTTATGTEVTLKVNAMMGTSAININLSYRDEDNNPISEDISFTIEVAFSIQEYLTQSLAGVSMSKIYDSDGRRSLVMDYGASVRVGNQNASADHLKLVFGDGTSEQAEWVSSNEDVIKIWRPDPEYPSDPDNPVNDSAKIRIQAMGVGVAQLTVSFTDETRTYEDTIDVYVRPKVSATDVNSGNLVEAGGVGNPLSQAVIVKNHAKVPISVLTEAQPGIAIGSKVVWAISKLEGERQVLIRDSLGNVGADADEATLVYLQNEKSYRLDAKSGVYTVEFYVRGTYKNFDDAHAPDDEDNPNKSKISAVSLNISVKCDFEDKDIILSLGSTYCLADAFNIPLKVLSDSSQFRFNLVDAPDMNSATYIAYDDPTATVSTKMVGKGQIRVVPRGDTYLPGLTDLIDPSTISDECPNGYIVVTVTVADTFSLNISQATIAVGKTLDLHGVIGSNTDAEPSQFVWTMSDEGYVTLDKTIGQYVTVTATRETPLNRPVKVSLAYTDTEGITWVAHCEITVTQSATAFTITPDNVRLEVGGSDYLQTNLTGSKNILWISSDPSIVTVEAQTGSVAAKVTATQKTGEVVITAINRDNDTYATAIVTVTAAITELSIDKGPTYTTSIATPYVFMEAVYEPKNATSTEMIWESSDKSVATVDEKTGMVTVLKLGQTTITVKPVYNPNGVFAQCILTVVDVPITGIKTDVTKLDMQKGDTYDVAVTLTPVNPTDRTLTWTSSKPSVATVNNSGRITAVSVGTATIIVQGGNAPQVMIEVNVREKLTSISFQEVDIVISVKQTKQLTVNFTPNEGVNKNLTFYSSDTSTVTVDNKGLITGIDVGKAMITCIAEDLGEHRPITCNVTVTEEIFVATDFTVDPLEKTISVGDEFKILPIFTPAETTNQDVTYESLDTDIASVTEDGVVTGIAPGQTVIMCTAVETNLTELCQVTVDEAIKFSLNPSSREIALGKSFTIKKVTSPNNIDRAATWQTSNSKIATISASGKVTGKKIGSCTITCTLKRYNQKATCRVKVAKLKSTIKLDKSSIRMNVGSTYRLKKTVTSNNSSLPSVKFTSANRRIATVGSSSGKITAKKVGSTVITAKTTDSVHAKAKCRVTVIRRATSISLNKTYAVCYIGSNIKLKATIKPNNASIKKAKWTSSDPNIAVVNSSGKVTGYAEGDVYITATTTDGSNKSSRCLVRVKEPIPATNIMVAQQKLTMQKGDTTQLSYTILPDDQTDTIKMASDNNNVASVTDKGKVKAKGTGTATITITSSSGITATVQVNVVALNKTSVRMRQYDTETLTVLGTTDAITWYSANNRIATVANGRIVGKDLGTTYIYAYVDGCRMSCRVEIVSVNSK